MKTLITLVAYTPDYEEQTLLRMNRFFGFHQGLTAETPPTQAEQNAQKTQSRETLTEWLKAPSALFIVMEEKISVGFLRIGFRGSNAAWIEDLFVDEDRQGQGIATCAIQIAEDIILRTPGYTAVCLEVVPRNADALKLYRKLGYTDISLVTLRKDFGESPRQRPLRLLDLDFHY